MKKILIVTLTLFVVNSAFSQVRFGIKAGPNMSSLSDIKSSVSFNVPGLPFGITPSLSANILKEDGMSIGYHAGAFLNIRLGSFISFQPELLFSSQGGKQKIDMMGIVEDMFGNMLTGADLEDILDMLDMVEDFGDIRITYKSNYITLPLLLEIKPIPFVNLGILAGPQFGMNLSKKLTVSAFGETETLSNSDIDDAMKELEKETGTTNPLKKMDIGLVMGLQYTFLDKITIGARYNLGLTNGFDFMQSFDLSEVGDIGRVKVSAKGWKNNVFQVSIGFSF